MNDNNTIQLAAVKGRTVWLQNLLQELLPHLNQPSTDYQTSPLGHMRSPPGRGHYQIIDEKDHKLRRSIAAGRNYFDYRISDGHGNIDGRLSIKLGLPDVQIIEQFQQAVLKPDDHPSSRVNYFSTTISRSNKSNDRDFSGYQPKHRDYVMPLWYTWQGNPAVSRAQSLPDKPKIMNESSNSASTNSMAIPSFFQSRLSTIADKLGITPTQTIQALFTWTEMGLSLALQLKVEELTPQAIFESIEHLQVRASNNLSLSDFDLDSTDSAKLDSHSLNQLSTSIRLISEALSRKHHSQSDKPHLQDTPGDRTGENSLQSKQPAPATTASQPSSAKSKSVSSNQEGSSRQVSKRTLEAETEVNRAIDAIIEFNNTENLAHKDKWHIGVSALRKLTQRGDSVIKRVLEPRANQIQQHHAQHQLSQRHNSKGKTYPSIDEVISL